MKSSKKAFSLLEISIIIAIIGLLTGGISVGNKLIKTAKQNRLISDLSTIETAIQSFYFFYKQLPGDYDNAEANWGIYNSITLPNGTLNGDNNRVIDWSTEGLRSFHHLQLAKTIKEHYTSSSSGVTAMTLGNTNTIANIKKAPYHNSGYSFYEENIADGNKNYIMVGEMISNGGSYFNRGGVLTGKESFTIDFKIDDKTPSSGKFRALYSVDQTNSTHPNGTNCINGQNTESGLAYITDSTAKNCVIYFLIQIN